MKLCPECKSDSIEKGYSIGLRVVVCIILLFIPFGIFFCWVPFIFPYRYNCRVCGAELKEEEIMNVDWRDKEAFLEKYKLLEEKYKPFLSKWIQDTDQNIYKFVKAKGQFILLKFSNNTIYPYRIIDYITENEINKFTVKGRLTSEFYLFKNQMVGSYVINDEEENEDPYNELSEFGKQVISKEEFLKFRNGYDDFIDWLKQETELITNTVIIDSTS